VTKERNVSEPEVYLRRLNEILKLKAINDIRRDLDTFKDDPDTNLVTLISILSKHFISLSGAYLSTVSDDIALQALKSLCDDIMNSRRIGRELQKVFKHD